MGLQPKHFTSRCSTSHRGPKDIFTAATANMGGDERRPHAGATCPASPRPREKRKRSRRLAVGVVPHTPGSVLSNLQSPPTGLVFSCQTRLRAVVNSNHVINIFCFASFYLLFYCLPVPVRGGADCSCFHAPTCRQEELNVSWTFNLRPNAV